VNDKNLKPFQAGADARRNKFGRPRKWVNEMRDRGYKQSEVHDCLLVLIDMTKDELKEIVKDKGTAALEGVVAGAILKSWNTKSMYNIETILTRVYGKPKETSESTGTQKIIVEYVNPNSQPLPSPPGPEDNPG
jgi:hypothetical protein